MTDDHVFLSYRSTEQATAIRIRDDLIANEIPVWMDNHGGIEGGDDWRQAIEDALDSASALIAMISPGYLESKWCRRELNRADSHNIPIIPVYIETVERLPIVIEEIQYIDMREVLDDPAVYRLRLTELITQLQEKSALEREPNKSVVANQRKTPRANEWTLYGIITLIVALLSFGVGILALPDDRLNAIEEAIDAIFQPEETRLLEPSLADLSLAVERESQYRALDGVQSPQDLTLAPTADGYALWGYGAVSPVLFAIDVSTADLQDLGLEQPTINLPDLLGDDFLPSELSFDGRWLWLGDARNDRIVALDPLRPTDARINHVDLAGDPTAIAHTGDILWVAQSDSDRVSALTVDSASGATTSHCEDIRLTAPGHMLAVGETVVWITAQTDDGFTLNRVNVQTCDVDETFDFTTRITGLGWFDETLVLAAGSIVYRVIDGEPVTWEVPVEAGIVDLLATDTGVWFLTKDEQLLQYDPEQAVIRVELRQDAPVSALVANGRQIWVAREDNTISRYLTPDYTYPDLVGITWLDDVLWAIDTHGELCATHNTDLTCYPLEIEAEPVILTADDATLWLGLVDNRLLEIDPADGSILATMSISGLASIEAILTVEQTLWVSDLFSQTVVIDRTTGDQTLLDSLNVAVPTAMAYDGVNVWFADAFSGSLFTVQRDGDQLRQGQRFDLPAPTDTLRLVAIDDTLMVIQPGSVYALSPTSGEVRSITGAGSRIDDATLAPDGLWLADHTTGFLYRVD
jgi:hypothetical protein